MSPNFQDSWRSPLLWALRLRYLFAALVFAVICFHCVPARAGVAYELDIITTEGQLRAGGVQEFPVVLREMIFPGPGPDGVFGRLPFKRIDATIEDPSRNSTPLDFISESGFVAEVTPFFPGEGSGIRIKLTADPAIFDSAYQTPIAGFSEWRIGRVRIDIGPPIALDDGDGGEPDGTLFLVLNFFPGAITVQPELDDPTSGTGAPLENNSKRYESSNFEQDDSQLTVADGELVVVDEPTTNIGIFRAVNGGELVLAADFVNFGTIEALANSTVTNQGIAIRQLEGAGTGANFDDTLTGGVFRAINGSLNVAPPGFRLASIEAGTLELSGALAETNLFDDASSSPGNFGLAGAGLTIFDGGLLRLEDNVALDTFDITLFGGRLEVFDGAEVKSFIGIAGALGTVAGDGSITATHQGLNVGTVEVGRGITRTGTLGVEGDASFQALSRLVVDIASDSEFDKLAVSGRLFIEVADVVGENDAAGLLINVAEGYVPALGHGFQIATAGEITGNFDIVCDNSPDVDFLPVVSAGTLTLQVVADRLGQFRTRHGLGHDGSDDNRDTSGNGVADIFYYVFGLGDPAAAAVDRTRLPTIEVNPAGGDAVFSFVRPIRSGCLRFRTLTSSDLASWVVPGSLGFEFLPTSETVTAIDADYQRVHQAYTVHPDDDPRFYMLGLEGLVVP